MKPFFKERIVTLLNRHRTMTIATNRPDGWPQATVVGYANDGLLIYCFVARDSQKLANVARDPRVSIAIAKDYPHPDSIEGLSLAGRVKVVENPGEIEQVSKILLARYPEYRPMPSPDPAHVPMLRITPEVVSILDYSKGFGHTDLVRVTSDDLPEYISSHRHHWAWFNLSELT